MERKDVVTMILALVGLICIILVVFQIFIIRSEQESQRQDIVRKADEARTEITQTLDDQSTLQVYALIVDTPQTRDLNPGLKYFTTVLPMLIPRQLSVPHICNGTLQSVQLDAYQVGLLVTHKNNGSQRLIQDVLAGRVQYLYIQRKPFFVFPVEDDVVRTLSSFTDTPAFNEIGNRNVFALYAINSPSNIANTPASSCQMAITSPFTNGPIATMEGRNGINLVNELGLSQTQEVMHAVGYKL